MQVRWWGFACNEEQGKTDCDVEPKQQEELFMVVKTADNSQLLCKGFGGFWCNQNGLHLFIHLLVLMFHSKIILLSPYNLYICAISFTAWLWSAYLCLIPITLDIQEQAVIPLVYSKRNCGSFIFFHLTSPK